MWYLLGICSASRTAWREMRQAMGRSLPSRSQSTNTQSPLIITCQATPGRGGGKPGWGSTGSHGPYIQSPLIITCQATPWRGGGKPGWGSTGSHGPYILRGKECHSKGYSGCKKGLLAETEPHREQWGRFPPGGVGWVATWRMSRLVGMSNQTGHKVASKQQSWKIGWFASRLQTFSPSTK